MGLRNLGKGKESGKPQEKEKGGKNRKSDKERKKDWFLCIFFFPRLSLPWIDIEAEVTFKLCLNPLQLLAWQFKMSVEWDKQEI